MWWWYYNGVEVYCGWHDDDNQKGENMTPPTPPVDDCEQLENTPVDNDISNEGIRPNLDLKWEIDEKRRCIVHLCGTRTVKVTSNKWLINKKTGQYWTRKVKVSKLICVAKNGGLESPSKYTPTKTRGTQKTSWVELYWSVCKI